MELKLPSLKPGGLSLSDCNSDPEEKEISEDDDDDRNHKHRRRETRSQSMEKDGFDQVSTRSYRKHNKPFPNGHHFRDNESQGSANWKNYKLVEGVSEKFDSRRFGAALLHRVHFDANQRNRTSQTFFGDPGSGRGRGSWIQRDSRFGSDIASQMVQQAPVPPSVFAGRGLPNVSNAHSASWTAFGLIPGLPNGGLDALHSIGLQGTLGPPIHSSLNMGITHSRCKDFEERGFCLRGDMCPMEHGVNRIVVDDVQSLSQFNLPVSLPSVHLLGTSTGPGSLAPVTASSAPSLNSKGSHGESSKHGTGDDGLGLNGPYLDCAGGGDLYDPDQPLWNATCHKTSNALLSMHLPKIDQTESLLNVDESDNEFPVRSAGNSVGSQSTVWDRIGNSKSSSDVKEKINPAVNYADYPENEPIDEKEALLKTHASHQGKRILAEDTGSKPMDSSSKAQLDTMRNNRKLSQKAMRTLFVNGIPHKSNKREALLAHFQKFGEVIDIYIPINSEQAFVQFSKRQEAEAALKSPDAIMGNRFIKLWWANRDSIPDDNVRSSNLSVTPLGETFVFMLPHTSAASSSKENLEAPSPKSSNFHNQDASLPASVNTMPVISNGPKVPPPLQKKLDSLEQLKEDLRKKQKMLERKQDDFRRKLDKLEKQTTGQKAESETEQAAKRRKVGITGNTTVPYTQRSSDSVSGTESSHAEMIDKKKASVFSESPKTNRNVVLQEVTCSKQLPVRPIASVDPPFLMNRYKLDNRSTVFRVLPPLPAGFENVVVLKEHFLQFGDLSHVELEDVEVEVYDNGSEAESRKDCSARITFTTRTSAERAFVSGKCWEGNNLKFTWLTASNSINDRNGKQKSSFISQGPSGTGVQPGDKLTCDASSNEDASSGNKEPENEERKNDIEPMELGEGTHPTPSLTRRKNKSQEDDASL